VNAADDSSLTYLCPHCKARLKARPADAGTRRECPRCGKMVKVPGSAGAPTHSGERTPGQSVDADKQTGRIAGQGVANIAIVCPVCGTRMYATRGQVGGTMVCPDCLETVSIELPAPPARAQDTGSNTAKDEKKNADPRPLVAESDVVSGPDSATPTDDDDELKLSEPIDVPRAAVLPKDLLDVVEQEEKRDRILAGDLPAVPPPAPSSVPAEPVPDGEPPREYGVKCPVCDTMIYVTKQEIGQTKTCPDCYSPVVIPPPAPKRKRVNEVEMDDDGETFTLAAPVDLEVYRKVAETELPTPGEMTLAEAEKRIQEREGARPTLPDHPLWHRLLRMLYEPSAIVRWGLASIVVYVLGSLAIWTMVNASKGGKFMIFAAGAAVGFMIVTVIGGTFISVSLLAVLQESSDGSDKVMAWPDLNFIDWMFDCLYVVLALFYSVTPGMLIASALSCAGAPPWLTGSLTFVGFFVLFPIVQLSLLEGASLGTPFTTPIIDSLRDQPRLWLTFYAITGAMILTVGMGGMFVPVDSSLAVLLVSIVWAFCLFVYFRLLGRLTWACRERAGRRDKKQMVKPLGDDLDEC